ncbi:hypothetical protein [Myxosarcina sp. GI1]|uniref:hypothetical protein n=1 Tax=Myxosarcina sp. GI1 TaxID=1541065 RepID=UPI00056D175F|nr:hypothetical protein [Myxosarcina sp. GI1]
MTTLLPSEQRSSFTTTERERLDSKVSQSDRADREIKYLHLKTEVDLLWEKLKTLKQQKQSLEAQLAAKSHESSDTES